MLQMEAKRPPKPPPAPSRDDLRLAHVHSTDRVHGVGTTTTTTTRAATTQVNGPWRRYQLTVDDGRAVVPAAPGREDAGEDGADAERKTLDPATRAGCVPATAYPSFRTMPPPRETTAAIRLTGRLPRVSASSCRIYHQFPSQIVFFHIHIVAVLVAPARSCTLQVYPVLITA